MDIVDMRNSIDTAYVESVLENERTRMARKTRFSRYWGKNKFNARRTRCRVGHDHRSKLESEYCAELRIKQRIGEIDRFVFEKSFKLIVNSHQICEILPDFLVYFTDGREEIHEVKGKELPEWRLKWKLMQALYPDYNYVVIK